MTHILGRNKKTRTIRFVPVRKINPNLVYNVKLRVFGCVGKQ